MESKQFVQSQFQWGIKEGREGREYPVLSISSCEILPLFSQYLSTG